jgi:hypothetical protein
MRLERSLEAIPESIQESLRVPFVSDVRVKRPIGLHVVEGPEKRVYVQYVKPDAGAARSKRIEVGDEIVAMSASWGDRMWEVNSVERYVDYETFNRSVMFNGSQIIDNIVKFRMIRWLIS